MRAVLIALVVLLAGGCGRGARDAVVLYTSQDQFYAEPILREFMLSTGIEVRSVFDTESVKTAGLANRLRQEASNPRCDVFWSNEEMHARMLAGEGVFPADSIRTVGYRTRRLVVNTNLMPLARAPRQLMDLTNSEWKGKIALAYPLYGTTGSQFLALRRLWGQEAWTRWCEGLVANDAKVVDGNSVVVKLVGAGEAWIGLTDSDDVAAGRRNGLPVEQAPMTDELLVIPNTLCVVRNREAPEVARLVEFLSNEAAVDRLVAAGALEGSEIPSEGLKMNWNGLRAELDEALAELKRIFLRT